MILVTGQPRGGLSLVWRLLKAAGFNLAFEPLNPWNKMPDDWADRFEGAKQPWSDYLGDGWKDFDKIVRVRRPCMDTCYSQWARDSERRDPNVLVARWHMLDDGMDDKIPHAMDLWYEKMCANPDEVMDEIIQWLGGSGSITGWGSQDPPEWFHKDYDASKIHAPATGLWRNEPAWSAYH